MTKRMAWAIGYGLAMLLLVEPGRSAARAQESTQDKDEVSVRGELVDLQCYVTRGARGAEHAGCANACFSRGVAAGLRTEDGRLYLLLGERAVSVKEQVAGRAGETVTVKGTLAERDGLRTLRLVAPIPPQAASGGR